LTYETATQILNVSNFAQTFFWKNQKKSWKNVIDSIKSVWLHARELKLCMNMLCKLNHNKCGLGVRDSPKKIRFSEHNLSSCYQKWTYEGFYKRSQHQENVFVLDPCLFICACGLLRNPAKVSNFQCRVWLCSMDQKFHGDGEKTREPRFQS
jgi:hypothetical protein